MRTPHPRSRRALGALHTLTTQVLKAHCVLDTASAEGVDRGHRTWSLPCGSWGLFLG